MTITDTTNYYKKERKTGIGGLDFTGLAFAQRTSVVSGQRKKGIP